MKKSLLLAGVMAMLFSAFAADTGELPAFDGEGAENAVVCGVKGLPFWNIGGKMTDMKRLDVINKTNESNIPIKIYYMQKAGGQWEELGPMVVGAPCSYNRFDEDSFGKDHKKMQYWAIVPQNGKKYTITVGDDYFNYFAWSQTFLTFSIYPEDPNADMSYKDNAVVVEMENVPDAKKFKDNFRIVNKTGDKDFAVRIYGFSDSITPPKIGMKSVKQLVYGAGDSETPLQKNQRIWIYGLNVESDAWNPIVSSMVKNDDSEYAEPDYHPRFYKMWLGPQLYKNFGLVFSNGKKYNVKAYVDDQDLYLELSK